MANCQERECVNVQSAICLHCQLYLCVTHIVDHGKVLLKEGDQLCEQINELAEQLNVYLQQMHLARDEVTDKLNIWRKNQIENIEQKYAENIQVIQFQKDHLTDLENQLTKRLTEEAIQPLEYMQTRQNASSESLKTIRQAITNIAQDSVQLDLGLNDSANQASSSSIVNTNNSYLSSSLQENSGAKTKYFINSSINPSDLQSLFNTQAPLHQTSSITANTALTTTTMQTTISSSSTSTIPKPIPASTTFKPSVTASSSTVPKPTVTASSSAVLKPTTKISTSTTPKPTSTVTAKPVITATASALPNFSRTQLLNSNTKIKRPPTNPCRNLIHLFQDVSGFSDHNIERFIVKNLNQVVHVNNLMVLLLSLLEAWHSPNSPTIINHNVLLHHINIVKKYIKGSEHQLTIIAACQVFLTHFKYDDQKSSEMINGLLKFFLNHQCITKETVLDWYINGAQYGYSGFEKAKQCAKPFIDQLNT